MICGLFFFLLFLEGLNLTKPRNLLGKENISNSFTGTSRREPCAVVEVSFVMG